MSVATAGELHRRALAESERGRHRQARRLLTSALRAAPDPLLRARVLISLAYHEAERHSLAAGLAVLAEADAIPDLPRRTRALVHSQRGLLRMRAGAYDDALADLDATLRLLDESTPEDLCRALLNRDLIHETRRNLALGRADLVRCADVAGRHGLDIIAAKATHNLGCLLLLAGDLPAALRQIDSVSAVLTGLSGPSAAVHHVDRSRILVAAGLTREADGDLARAVELFGAAGIRQDQAEAELARAQVAAAEERWEDAVRLATTARRRFRSRGAEVWVLLAELVAVSARVGSGRVSASTVAAAVRLAGALAAAGLPDESRRAALTAAAAELSRGRASAVRAAAAREVAGRALRLRADDPISTRLRARTVRARLAEAEDRPARANAERRAALADLHRYQASFGSLDLQTAVSGLGRRIAAEGLARALSDGRPAAVFGWAERARALSSRLPSVTPPDDPESARLLEELRQTRTELRERLRDGPPDAELRARRAELERQVRQRAWQLSGSGRSAEPVPLARVESALAAAGGTLVAHLVSRGTLHALVLGGGRRTVRALGPAAAAQELQQRAHADLDALASTALPARVRATVRESGRRTLAELDERLFGPIRGLLTDGPLVLTPAAGLRTVPWTMLRTATGRPVTVVPSATSWVGGRSALPADPVVRAFAGPRIARGADELTRIASVWPKVDTVAGATAAQVRAAAVEADLLHVAAHGVHEADNPLFSHLELADGPLFGHELDILPRLPAHVVFSACDLGLADTRPGDETLGMVAAVLHGGAGSVVAGVARVSDAVAVEVGAAHHAALRHGLSPAAALASALAAAPADPPAPLVCFGAGW